MKDFVRGYTTSGGTFNPSVLFSCICKKAPRFRGYAQQDSQELLHALLDALQVPRALRRLAPRPPLYGGGGDLADAGGGAGMGRSAARRMRSVTVCGDSARRRRPPPPRWRRRAMWKRRRTTTASFSARRSRRRRRP